ncbi:MAG TPA: hypothetical protein VER96_37850 [Polyangiaceae bacterium]|nr:hypothetical protein [Polyangiaceae bacterium]
MRDPYAAQIRLSRVHTRLVPMQANGVGYSIDPAAAGWFELPTSRGFAGYGLGRALGLLLDAMCGLSALNETTTENGAPFAHGEFTPLQFRVDPLGVCRLVPLTTRHYVSEFVTPPRSTLGFLSPERLIAEKVGLRADVFSAGVLLWEALAGRRLIDGDRPEVVAERLLSRKIRVPSLPPQLDWATPLKAEVERALSINQQKRFADCAEFSEVILRLAQDRFASHDEIAAFFASNFSTTPCLPPISEPSSRSPVSVSRELPIANPGATFRMLPAASLGPAPIAEAAPQRHATLKMNVTLRMAHVPLPILGDEPRSPVAAPPSAPPPSAPQPSAPQPSAPPPLGSTPVPASYSPARLSASPPPPSSSAVPRSFTPPPAPASYPPPRLSPPPLPAPRRSSPPPLPALRRSSPPPLPNLRAARQSFPPPLPFAPFPPDSLPNLTIPAPPLLEFEDVQVAPAEAPPIAPPRATEVISATPVPTQMSFLHPPTITSIPPTTTEPPPETARSALRKRALSTLAVAFALIAGVTAAIKIVSDQAVRHSTASARTGVPRGVSAGVESGASISAPKRAQTPPVVTSANAPNPTGAESPSNTAVHAADVTPNAERPAAPSARPPSIRVAPGGALPAGKDYGI